MKGILKYTHPRGRVFEITSVGDLNQWREVKPNEIEQPWQKVAWPFEELGNLIDHLDEKVEDDNAAAFYSCCIVLHNKAYGGPEEGGWWYDTYEPIVMPGYPLPVFTASKDQAEAWCDEHDEWCQKENKDRLSPSALNSEGHYTTMIFEEEMPCSLPKERPHYE